MAIWRWFLHCLPETSSTGRRRPSTQANHCGVGQLCLTFWRDISERYDSAIENLALAEVSSGRILRRARLHHHPREGGETLTYEIVQMTELRGGWVVRQVNSLDPPAPGRRMDR